ncbi:M56 family metallopeptidase [Lacrimispora sp. NSJ-141]|uniref:M56 family metallopeptidase n=2 Tax=Lientehia hominis TaxID=2897778 RepID=A0AAP2RHS6_9FIRM|nr:M56 family metallopeptidase [Lientehia hominis]MCD2492181.1 M56 family metallopeptidase [Lientehia hominis]
MDGILFRRTPFFVWSSRIFSVVWCIGFFCEISNYIRNWRILNGIKKRSKEAGNKIERIEYKVEERLRIRRRIPVYLSEEQEVPVIGGFWRSVILLPDKVYREEELEMILEHELWHYKQRDLLLKKLCGWIVRVEWFNPLTRYLFSEVDRWGDALCDVHICFEGEKRWSRKKYFNTVINNCSRGKVDFCSGMRLQSDLEDVRERIDRMGRYKSKLAKKRFNILLTAIFILMSSVTAMAAGRGIESIYDEVYDATEKRITEPLQPQQQLEEFERLPGDDVTIIRSDENMGARTSNTFSWTLSPKTLKETGQFYASKGSSVTISVTPDPMSAKTGIGLDQPYGYLRGVSGTGAYNHTFAINESGYYRAYAENLSGNTITVGVTVVR